MPKVRTIGIIGLGSIGIRHKNNLWQKLGQTEVVGYDPDPAKQVGTGWVIGDLDKMIEMSDAIIVASPTEYHTEHTIKCIEANKPFFMEKPVGGGLYDNLYDKIVMVGYNLHFHSCVKKAKEWLDAGRIGKPIWANFTLGQHSEKPPYLRVGVTLNWSHEIDLAIHLLGYGRVAGSSTRLSDGKDDLTDILFTHDNGCHSAIHLDYLTKPEVRQFIIVGDEATIIVDLLRRHAWLRSKDDVIIGLLEGKDSWDTNYVDEMEAFLQRLDGKDTIGCSGQEGLAVLKVCLEVRRQAGL